MQKAGLSEFVTAVCIYAGFALYLFLPHFKHFQLIGYLLPVNICLAALGCYLLSQRWVAAFWGSFLAGTIYGFGPYMLGLTTFHPAATLLAASLPWLFCPAAFAGKRRWRWKILPLSALPFLAILIFFQVAAHYHLFPAPTRARLRLADLAGLLAPLVMTGRSITLVGFYHVPIAALLTGFLMLLAARRLGILIIFAVGTILAWCNPLLQVSPVLWLAVPVLCCSVLIGEGMQGLALAGFSDRKPLLVTMVLMGILAMVALFLANKYLGVFAGLGKPAGRLFTETAKFYILAALAVGVIFFLARAKWRLPALRWTVLAAALTVDIFLGARFIVDSIFR